MTGEAALGRDSWLGNMFDADESTCRELLLVNVKWFGLVDDDGYIDDGTLCFQPLEDISSCVIS